MPHTGAPVAWHQDGAYWPLEPMEVITLWLAVDRLVGTASGLDPNPQIVARSPFPWQVFTSPPPGSPRRSDRDNGCLRVVRGSHKQDLRVSLCSQSSAPPFTFEFSRSKCTNAPSSPPPPPLQPLSASGNDGDVLGSSTHTDAEIDPVGLCCPPLPPRRPLIPSSTLSPPLPPPPPLKERHCAL